MIRELLALLLCLFAGGLGRFGGYLRWLRNEKSDAPERGFAYTHSLLIISVIFDDCRGDSDGVGTVCRIVKARRQNDPTATGAYVAGLGGFARCWDTGRF